MDQIETVWRAETIWVVENEGASCAIYWRCPQNAVILLAALLVLPTVQLPLSIVSAFLFDLILLLNHQPGRYVGF